MKKGVALLAVFLIVLTVQPALADVQVNASVLNVVPVVDAISDHAPDSMNSALCTSSNPADCATSDRVRINVTWHDDNGDSVTLYVCSSNALNGANDSCAATTYCSNTTAQTTGNKISCTVNPTPCSSWNSWEYTYYVILVDSNSKASTGTSSGTFYIDTPATVTNVQLGLNPTMGTFQVGNTIVCRGTITIASNQAPSNIRYAVYGPDGTINNLDFYYSETAYGGGQCNSTAWSAGKGCNYTWAIPTSGTTSGACRAEEGTWSCRMNATTTGGQTGTSSTVTSSLINTAPTLSWTGGGVSGSVSPGSAMTITGNYSDPNGYNDVNTSSADTCSGTDCAGRCWNTYRYGTNDPDTGGDGWDRWEDQSVTLSSTGGEYGGCSTGGYGWRLARFSDNINDMGYNGTWNCRFRLRSDGTTHSWTANSAGSVTTRISTPVQSVPSIGWSALTPGGGWQASNIPSGVTNVTLTNNANWIVNYRGGYWGNLSASCTTGPYSDPGPYIDVSSYLRYEALPGQTGSRSCTDGSGHTSISAGATNNLQNLQNVVRGNNEPTANRTEVYMCISVPTGTAAQTYRRNFQVWHEIQGGQGTSINQDC